MTSAETTDTPHTGSRRQWAEVARLRLPEDRVRRPEIMRRLDRMLAITHLHSLPGTGKTTILAEWAMHRLRQHDSVLWINCSPELDSLPALASALADIVLDRPGAAPVIDDTEVIEELCRSEPRRPVIIVTDGAEHFTDPALRGWLLDLCGRFENVHLAGSSDTMGPISDDVTATRLPMNVALHDRGCSRLSASLGG